MTINTLRVKLTIQPVMRSFLNNILILITILFIATSCGPVHMFTRVKKVPREYSMNYCGGEIKASKTDINKKPWIVYSDRANNATYNNAGGKIKAKDIDYLEPFLVIGKKKEHLKLIKYTPDILKNGKLDYKKAEYYGWIHKSNLLLNYQSVTDISTGRKNKQLVAFSDTTMLGEPEKYFENDSIKLYKDLKMEEQIGNTSIYTLVYPLKQSEDRTKTLIAKKTELTPETVGEDIMGWIDNGLLQDAGQVLYVDRKSIPEYKLQLKLREELTILSNEEIKDQQAVISEQYKSAKYNPVYSYGEKGMQSAFKTALNLPMLDYSLNYIFNVNGGHISYRKFRSISKKLKHINIVFILDGKQHTISHFPQIVNALQNLQPLFENRGDDYLYRFGCVMDFDTQARSFNPVSKELNSDYSQLINYLSDKANRKKELRPINVSRAWGNVNKAFDLVKSDPEATNLFVVIGETGYSSEEITEEIKEKLAANNCRVIGFQVYTGEADQYNNFVLNIELMVTSYSDKMLKTKGDILVSPKQLRYDNYFTEVGELKNGYRLDFPENSITQGAVFFPQKGESLSLDILTNNVDTIVQQIKEDNTSLIQYMSSAFAATGNNRTRFDSLFVIHHGLQAQRIPQKNIVSGFKKDLPGWALPSQPILLDDSLCQTIDYKLLLNEDEMQEVREFVESLSKYEVDYIDIAKAKKKKAKKPCNCPDDDIFVEIEQQNRLNYLSIEDDLTEKTLLINNSIDNKLKKQKGKYANTAIIRRHLYNLYMKRMQYCKLCKQKKKHLKRMTLAKAQARITHCPAYSEELMQYTVRDLKKKKRLTDSQLEELIIYFKEMKKKLDEVEKFESNGQVYYWVDKTLLP